MEYIEGGQVLEDTYGIRAFYGLKGNVTNNGAIVVQYSEGTDSHNMYAGNISGTGSFSADTYIGKPRATFTTYAAAGDSTEPLSRNSTLQLKKDVNATVETTQLTSARIVNQELTMKSGSTLATVTCSSFNLDILSGDLLLDLSDIWADMDANDYLAVLFTNVGTLAEGTSISVDIPDFGRVDAATFVPASEGISGTVIYVDLQTIPEPTTATLSMLALAALAARRRRKK